VPDTATPTAPRLFTTRRALDDELAATGTFKALHAAVHTSTPHLTAHAHRHGSEPVTGLRFTEDTPHTGRAHTSGSAVVTPDGILTIRAYTIPGHRWHTALQDLGAHTTAHGWSVRPHTKNRSFSGRLQPADHVQATTLTELPDGIGDVTAMLTLAPDSRAACPAAWLLAVGFFHVLATGAPARLRP
jgi:hypothetical protein